MNEGESVPLLDRLLQQFPDTPKSRGKQWIVAGRVTVNGLVIRKPHQAVGATDLVELEGRKAAALDCGNGWKLHPRVTLLYLDASLAVVNKGPGLISVPAAHTELSALSILADFLAGKLKPRQHGLALPPAYRHREPLPVHRLDQYTSGVFCMAMNPGARKNLIDQVRGHFMTRQYLAFVEGTPLNKKGMWRNWLKLTDDESRQQIVDSETAGAVEAVTHYEMIAQYQPPAGRAGAAKLSLRLETGLKHQIRVQAAHAGLPLIGDRAYNFAPAIEFSRQALHAETLGLKHPLSGKEMKWSAKLPDDLRELENKLRA